eukprot:3142574-Rhodomonas_salina.1
METDAAAVHSRIECKRLFAHSGGIRIVIKALESLETAGPHHLLTGLEVLEGMMVANQEEGRRRDEHHDPFNSRRRKAERMQERVELVGICSRLLRKVAVDTWNLAIASLDHDPSRLEDRRQNHGKGPNSIAGRSDATNDSLAEPDISDERQGSGTRTSDEIDSEDDSKLLTGKAGQES